MTASASRQVRRRADRQARKILKPVLLSGLLGLAVVCSAVLVRHASAQAPAAGAQNQEPVLLVADTVTFDEETGIVTATGNVELSQGPRTVRADTITYNQKTKVVTASGNIRLVEPTGEILFADYAELTDDMAEAFVTNVRMLMTDNSRMAGTEGERRGGRMTRVNRAVYSPCELCKDDPSRAPLWQIRAVRVVHDNEAKEIRYRDAVLELFGLPVAYTPYLSHPDPTVDRRTGMLAPVFGRSSDLGMFLRTYTYIDIAPEQDATVEVTKFGSESLLLGGEYRRRFEKGNLLLSGSITRGDLTDAAGDFKRKDWRGHIAGRGLFEIDDTWRWGFEGQRASEYTYLKRYFNYRDQDVLTSKAFVEGFRGRNYAGVTAYSFQDLRYNNTTQEPLVLPEGVYSAYGEPGGVFGGRWSLDAGVLSILRPDGPSSRRFSVAPGWRREMVSDLGFITTLNTSVLMAGYQTNDYDRPDIAGTTREANNRFRFFPSADITVRYPFVRYGESSSQLIEPIGQFRVAPQVSNNLEVPNEDSLDVEFDETNLFMPSRYTGIDRLEGGMRATYGVRAATWFNSGPRASVFLGQSYRITESTDYAYGSGLENQQSDYVGRVELVPGSWFDANYSFRLDQGTLEPRRHALSASTGYGGFRMYTNYTYLDQFNDPYTRSQSEIEQATFGASLRLGQFWSASVAHVQAYTPEPGPRVSLGVLTYQDECFTFDTVLRRDFTDSPGETGDGTTLYFRLVFKNIGEFKSPTLSGGLFGGRTDQTSTQ